jgi:choline dehydrogenase
MVGVMRPKSRGSVTLRSPDVKAPPVIRHQLLGNDDDLEQLSEGIAEARRIFAQPSFARHISREIKPGPTIVERDALRAHIRQTAIPMYHPVGTCRIGTDAMSVADPNLRVHGIDHLWIADASVMPSIPSGNTNATSIMIGDKGADHVRAALSNRV